MLLVELGQVRATAACVAGEEAGARPIEMSEEDHPHFLVFSKAQIGSQIVSSERGGRLFLLSHLLGF